MKFIYYLFIIIVFLSIFLTYDYTEFNANMSVGSGHAYMAKSLGLSYDFNVNEYWGNAGVDVFKYKNDYYVAYAPLNAVIMGAFYFILQIFYHFYTKYVGTINGDISILIESITLSLPSSIALVLIGYFYYKIIKDFIKDKTVQVWLIVSLLLGTILFNYSVSFFNHNIAALFILLAFYLVQKNTKTNYLLGGIFTGLAFLTEFPTILFSVAVAVRELYLFKVSKRTKLEAIKNLIVYSVPVAISILLIGLYNYIHFDNPLTFSEHLLYDYKLSKGMTTHKFDQNPIYGIWGLYFSPLKGLFLISPFLLYFFLAVKKYFKDHTDKAILIITYIILVSFVYAMWPDCFGATAFGPRYLISVIPLIAIIAAYYFTKAKFMIIPKVMIIISCIVIITNVLDGLPSGKLFGGNCNTLTYAAYYKTVSVFKSRFIEGPKAFRPVIFDMLF